MKACTIRSVLLPNQVSRGTPFQCLAPLYTANTVQNGNKHMHKRIRTFFVHNTLYTFSSITTTTAEKGRDPSWRRHVV